MTVSEIKATYSMRDILAKYGMQVNRSGFCRCPFHSGDNTASLKVYEKDFHCFGCGVNGDIFTFVQMMDGCDFKTAFLSLGGEYEKKPSFSARAGRYRAQKAREQRQKTERRQEEKKATNNTLITFYRRQTAKSEPFSDAWCDSCAGLEKQLRIHADLNDIPY
ncbi:MAG: CHC2 zinc finger domain-containing protein [Clostridiaceae bacterium]|nr:CHC2 zinc finger domain-containing protein [Clostridiaceae bacterium]